MPKLKKFRINFSKLLSYIIWLTRFINADKFHFKIYSRTFWGHPDLRPIPNTSIQHSNKFPRKISCSKASSDGFNTLNALIDVYFNFISITVNNRNLNRTNCIDFYRTNLKLQLNAVVRCRVLTVLSFYFRIVLFRVRFRHPEITCYHRARWTFRSCCYISPSINQYIPVHTTVPSADAFDWDFVLRKGLHFYQFKLNHTRYRINTKVHIQ